MAARTKFKTVDEYFSTLHSNTKSIMVELRRRIKKTVPEAEELISYNIPAFKFHGLLIWYAAFTEHVSIFPKTTAIKAFAEELSKYKVSKGTIQFPVDKPLPFGLITKIVKFRVKENLEQEKKLKKKTANQKNKGVNIMAKGKSDLLTAGKIAAQLGVSGPAVSKTIKTLGIKPDLVKAGCSYYGTDTIKKVKAALK